MTFQTQEREAKNKMREKAKELQRVRIEAAKRGTPKSNYGGSSGGFGNNSISSGTYSPPKQAVVGDVSNDVKNNYSSLQ